MVNTVDMVYAVDMVFTVDGVYTVDMVYTIDMVYTMDTERDDVVITAPNECVCDNLLKPCLCPWLCPRARDFLCAWLMSCTQKIKAMVVRMAVTMSKFSVLMALSTHTENQG